MPTKKPPAPLEPHWFQILLALADRDLHGLAVMNDVLERTGGRMRLWPGITKAGRRACAAEAERLAGFVAVARRKKLLRA